MPSDQVKSALLAVRETVGDELVTVFSNNGYSTDASDRVFANAAPKGTPQPFSYFTVREQPSVMAGNKTDDPVRAVAQIQVQGEHDVDVAELAKAIQNRLCDSDHEPSFTGFSVLWHDLLFHEPLNEIREDAPNIYRRVLEIEYQLDPT